MEDFEVIRARAATWLRALRVNQWTKNALVFMAWCFAFADDSQAAMARGWHPFFLVAAMAGSFCLLSSAFYLLNDVSDCDADRRHPVKCRRPVAAGLISKEDAVRAALALFACAMAYPSYLVFRHPDRTWGFAVILIYVVIQSLYSGVLKRIPYVDVAVIAIGFVLRAVAGAAATAVRISPWLLVCSFVLSLFLALCKRRHEMAVAADSRTALKHYNPLALNILIFISAVATFCVYTCYTLAPDTVARFHTRALSLTAGFVGLGVARYLVLVYSKADVGRPEKILLSDRRMWLILLGYVAAAVFAAYLGRTGGASAFTETFRQHGVS